MKVIIPGHKYILSNLENPENGQTIQFIEKRRGDSFEKLNGLPETSESKGVLVTLQDGTTNEEVIACLIDRITFLNATKLRDLENETAIAGLRMALSALNRRRDRRANAGTLGTPAPSEASETDKMADQVLRNKSLRVQLDGALQSLKDLPLSRERSLAITKLQEGIMWLGMDLKRINEACPGVSVNPYPSSKDPSSTKIEPTADGLKL